MDRKQRDHFERKENRYREDLLILPPKHVIEETQKIIQQLKAENCREAVDFGSGNGRLTIPLLQAHFRVTAVDISRTSLKILVHIIKRYRIRSGLLSTASSLPKKRVTAIVGCDILHHVSLDETLHSIRKHLQKEGMIVFSEPNILNISWSIFVSLNRSWRVEGGMRYCSYINFFRILKKNKFERIRLYGYGLFPPIFFNTVPLLQKINYFLGNLPLLKLFAYRYIITAYTDP